MKTLLYIAVLLLTASLSAQNLTDYVPQNTSYLLSVNFGQLNTKSNQLDYSAYLKPLIKKNNSYGYYGNEDESCEILNIEDMLKTPAEFGIDLNTNVYIYTTRIQDVTGTTYLFRIDKPETFEARLNTSCTGKYTILKKQSGQTLMYVAETMSVAINGNVATIFSRNPDYSFYGGIETPYSGAPKSYEDSIYIAEISADERHIDSLFFIRLNTHKNLDYEKEQQDFLALSDTMILHRAMERQAERLAEKQAANAAVIFDLLEKMLAPQTQNMGGDRNFMKLVQDKHDAFVYVNMLSNISSDFLNPFSSRYYGKEEAMVTSGTPRVLTADISSSYTVDFDKGKATLHVISLYNKAVYPYMKKAYGVKQDKKLFRYIDAQNLLGYMSVSVNAKELAKFYEDFYREMLDHLPKRERDTDILTGMDLFYAFVDKEVLFNTLNGQAILACTGFADVKVKYTSYDYDDDYKKTEKIEERIEQQPKMVLVSAIGNEDNARKLFNIISKFSAFTKIKDNVFAFYGNQYAPVNVYFALIDDVFIITNDAGLVLNNQQGYPKSRQMAKSDRNFIGQHNFAFKVYGQKMLEGIKDTYFKNGETLPWFSQLMTNLGDLEMYDEKPTDNSYQATAVITLKDGSSNALYQLLKMMSAVKEH